MKYPYMTLPDETEITHGDIREDGTVLVYIETPVKWGLMERGTVPRSNF